jgi:hypothetical protein
VNKQLMPRELYSQRGWREWFFIRVRVEQAAFPRGNEPRGTCSNLQLTFRLYNCFMLIVSCVS